jgi:DNA-binding MarR family transcriptional regulator
MSTNPVAPFPAERGTRRWLTADEERGWRAFRRILVVVTERTAKDLAATGLSMPDYEVLSTLVDRADHCWGLRDMAAKMEWSRSRLSHQITRMEKRGLIERAPDPGDGRGVLLRLTDTGYTTLKAATPTHLASVRARFVDHVTPEEMSMLESLADRVHGPVP